jgi:trimethylamine monooxygenase
MYAGLRTNIPSEGMACRRQPFPEETAMFPTQAVVLCYLQNRAKQVAQYIRYGTVVTRVRKDEGATKWTVETRSLASGDLASEDYDYVLVANGHCERSLVPV